MSLTIHRISRGSIILNRVNEVRIRVVCVAVAVGVCLAGPAHAQEPPAPASADKASRIFWLLPNFTTIEAGADVQPITTKEAFTIAAQDSFDPYVIPYLGLVVLADHVTNQEPWGSHAAGLGKLYAAAFADNAIGNFMTQAVVPWALKQDPRYFQLGKGSLLHRAGYALSRSVVTRSAAGNWQFNVSEVGGNALAAGIGVAYYPAADRSRSALLSRWESQMVWDALSFELKEFWPDIRRALHKD
jgi:hypothetical protein